MDAALRIARTIATEINATPAQVTAAAGLLDGGATVPFVARYRKEVTGGLDDTQLRALSERLVYLREMESRRQAILGSIRDQGKLTDELTRAIMGADTKASLEDIYLPYKPKRRTKAMIAREKGLEPLLRSIIENRQADPVQLAASYTGEQVPDTKAALDGARDILVEELAENATLLGGLRDFMRREAFIAAKLIAGKEEAGAKFSDYFDHREKWADIPGHRALAILRAAKEEIVTIEIAPDPDTGAARAEGIVAQAIGRLGDGAGDQWLRKVAGWTWRVRLSNTMYIDLLTELRKRAHDEAIRVFGRNLKDLLLAAPAGAKTTIGLDPGIRTGVKVAVVDGTGKLIDTATIYPFQPRNDLRGAEATLLTLIQRHDAALIA
ncbi:Tex-like N-terminal domain-containing protein, partial [Paracoccus seriniphilus]|uniref:Tex-like N-terminal domain-containing protein n=1 Tax=Paracoccus seriniphilus TaxID=184748 RepID=UPI0035658DA2